jgi:hypothetical protein
VNFPAPRLLDVVDGFEVVSFIPVDSGPAGWAPVVPDAGVRAFAHLVRDYHVAVRGFTTDKLFYTGTPAPTSSATATSDPGTWCSAMASRSGQSTSTTRDRRRPGSTSRMRCNTWRRSGTTKMRSDTQRARIAWSEAFAAEHGLTR